jgi:hypothetical protein
MYKSFAMHHIDRNYLPSVERWYFRDHGPEIARRHAPWLVRCESFLPPYWPEEAKDLGFYNWRSTVCYWREIPNAGYQGDFAFTSPKIMATVASAIMPPQPTEDFLGGEIRPGEKDVLRFVHFIKYPEGVSKEAADTFYVDVFAKEALQQTHMYRFFSYKTLQLDQRLPGVFFARTFSSLL